MSATQHAAFAPRHIQARFVRRWHQILLLAASFLALLAHADDSYYDIAPPGQRLDIGGYKLHLYCQGTGSPTVVLDAGLGDWSSHWTKVQELVSADTRVCSYDRAGYGWSDPGPRPRSSARVAIELHALLQKAELPPPYILVGHSFGGFNMRLFSASYADEVAGLILLDASHPGSMPYRRDENSSAPAPTLSNYLMLMEPLAANLDHIPPQAIAAVSNNWLHTKSLSTSRAEYRAMALSVTQVQEAPGLGDIPLVVISRGRHEWVEDDARERSWQAQQDELVRMSRQGTRKIAQASGHHIHLEQPQLVADTIRELILAQRREPAAPPP